MHKLTMELAPDTLDLTNQTALDCIRKCGDLAPYTLVRFWKTSDGPPKVWRLKIDLLSGKTWQQDFTYNMVNDPDRTFPNGQWTLAETSGVRALTDWFLTLQTQQPEMTSFKLEIPEEGGVP
jgi:hypothetical protein